MNRIFRVIRYFSEENPFKDSEGRFRNRWDVKQNPTLHITKENQIPMYKVRADHKIDKKRIFDFDLPKELITLTPPLSIWSMSDQMFSVNQVWIPGPILIFADAVFQWHASRAEEIEEHHLEIIKVIEPRTEYAIIGTGGQKSLIFAETLRQRFRMLGIHVDFCPTVIYI